MGMGIVIVEVCDSNLMSALDLEHLEQEYPEIAVMRADCLSLCGLCRKRPYVLVNGKRIFAKTQEECLELTKRAIEDELHAYDI